MDPCKACEGIGYSDVSDLQKPLELCEDCGGLGESESVVEEISG